jgi:hypothetical protein
MPDAEGGTRGAAESPTMCKQTGRGMMTTPERDPLGDTGQGGLGAEATEADVAEQRRAVDDGPDGDAMGRPDPSAIAERDWQANEADLIEQAIAVPVDDEFDR